jgi:2-keto-4-pentenoate hydratase/2-oxohepta-3-ene-1,7-dioic acid hydratase in catechol pathway
MRLVRFDGGRTGVLVGDADDGLVVGTEGHLPAEMTHPGASWHRLIAEWGKFRDSLAKLERNTRSTGEEVLPLSTVALQPPLPGTAPRCFAMGGNFPAHAAGVAGKLAVAVPDSDTPPWGFYVIPGTIVGTGEVVSPPAGTQKLDYEAELCAVLAGPLGDDGTVPIWGYTAWNDFSIRDAAFGLVKVDHGPLTWSLQKNFATGNSCGPWMVVDEPVADGVSISCRVNGESRQDGVTTEMKFGFSEIAAHLTTYLPLAPGDMILSGTPSGCAMEQGVDGPFLHDGDLVEVEVGRAGVLSNRIAMQ